MAARAPEEIIRDWLAQNGPTRVKIDAFEQTWASSAWVPATAAAWPPPWPVSA